MLLRLAYLTVTNAMAALRLLPMSDRELYPVEGGATTIWERWDSLLPDGTVNPGDMTSFNHYAFGSVADWMHREVAGLRRTSPGWRLRARPGQSARSGICPVPHPVRVGAHPVGTRSRRGPAVP